MSGPAFPGGTSVSRLTVYTGRCADGLEGGTPHVHTASTEAYVVTAGHGALHTLSGSGFAETPLHAGTTVWFTPGTIHRAVNRGGLQVVVVMSNAGLPEAGDAVMTFPPEVLADPEAYRAAATLPPDGDIEAAVERRRDLAVDGFRRLTGALRAGDPAPLEAFYARAAALVRPAVAGWRRIWDETVAQETRRTAEVLDALQRGDPAHLREAAVREALNAPRWGMCGHLTTHPTALPTDQDPA